MAAEPLQGERHASDTGGAMGATAVRVPKARRSRGDFPGRPPWTLMYHSVDSDPDDPFLVTVTPERFVRQMDWLRARGMRGVSMRELLAAHERGQAAGLVGLTFDDGYADFPREVLPVLLRHNFTASLYVVAGRMGGHNAWDPEGPRKPLVTIAQVRQLAAAGMEIGSHSLSHCRMPGLPGAELALETRRSRELLEGVLERPVEGFCYPYGDLDDAAQQAVAAAGYSYAVGICHQPEPTRWALPRCYVGERDGGLRLRAKQFRHFLRGWSC